MARKLRKRRTSPSRLFVEILIPWVVMALVAISLDLADVSFETTIVVAVASALAATFLINRYERARILRRKT